MIFEVVEKYMLCENYWIAVGSNRIAQVGNILQDGLLTREGWAFSFEDVTGIELDADWLKGANFDLQQNGEYKKPGFPFTLLLHEYAVVMLNDYQVTGFRFVHELQHFYAGVKQRELSITPPSNINLLPDLHK